MTTPVKLISQMRRIAKVTKIQYDDDVALDDLNTLKDELWTGIVSKIQDKYIWEKWTTDLEINQSEYLIPEVSSTNAGAKLLNAVSIAYNTDTYLTGGLKYIPAREVNPNGLEFDWDYYAENQDKEDPIYYVADNSIFIAPVSPNKIVGGIKLTGIKNIPDYTLATTEAQMKIPLDQQKALLYGLIMFGYMAKAMDDNTINNAEARWIRKRDEAIRSLEVRVDSPVLLLYPDE